MDFALKMLNSALKMLYFVFKMLYFALKMLDFVANQDLLHLTKAKPETKRRTPAGAAIS